MSSDAKKLAKQEQDAFNRVMALERPGITCFINAHDPYVGEQSHCDVWVIDTRRADALTPETSVYEAVELVQLESAMDVACTTQAVRHALRACLDNLLENT